MTPLLRRIAVEKRALLLPLAVALVVNVLVYAFAVYPLGVKSAGSADRAAAALNARRAAEHDETLARALVSGKARADDELNAFYEKVLPASHAAAERLTYASLPALAQKTKIKYEERRWTGDDKDKDKDNTFKNGSLGHLGIRMVLTGDWENIRTFIYQLESAPDFIIIDDVTLLEGKNNEPLTLTIDLSTYFRQRINGT